MRFCVLAVLAAMIFGASDVFAMGKSDGSDKKVKSAVKSDACCKVEKAECTAEQKAKCAAGDKKCDASCDKKKGECTAEQKAKCAAEGKTCDASCPEKKVEGEAKKVEAVKSEAKPAVAVKAVTPEPKVDELWLMVNGTEIRESKIDEALAGQFANMEKSGRKLPDEMKDTFRRQAAQKMIVEVLVEQKIAEKKITSTDEEVNGRLSEMAEQQGMDLEKYLEMAKTQGGIEPDELKRRVKMGIGFEKLMELESADEGMTVTQEDAKEFYDKNVQRFTKLEQVKPSHILAGGRGITDEQRVEAKIKIADVKKKLDAGGNFEEIAKEFSDCPSKEKGGDLDVMIDKDGNMNGRPGGGMDKTFSQAAMKLEVGEVSEVIETPFGFHIIKITEKLPGGVTSFEDAKEMIIANEQGRKKQQFSGKYIEGLKKEANIVWVKEAPAPRQPRPAMPVQPKKAVDAKTVEEKK